MIPAIDLSFINIEPDGLEYKSKADRLSSELCKLILHATRKEMY